MRHDVVTGRKVPSPHRIKIQKSNVIPCAVRSAVAGGQLKRKQKCAAPQTRDPAAHSTMMLTARAPTAKGPGSVKQQSACAACCLAAGMTISLITQE